jgi:putative transposase
MLGVGNPRAPARGKITGWESSYAPVITNIGADMGARVCSGNCRSVAFAWADIAWARLMRLHGLRSICRPRYRRARPCPLEIVAKNALQRNFTATRPNHKWAGDITYIATREGWLYLAVLLDLYSRRVVGWAMGPQITTGLISQALKMALHQRPIEPGLLHHSDRGCQYAARAYQQRLTALGIHCSMSRPGNCWDNAVVESFFATLKTELIYHRQFQTRQEAKTEIFAYLEGFYNRRRRHSTLGYLSPVEFERQAELVTQTVH